MDDVGLADEVAVNIRLILVESLAVLGPSVGSEDLESARLECGDSLVDLFLSTFGSDLGVQLGEFNSALVEAAAPVCRDLRALARRSLVMISSK